MFAAVAVLQRVGTLRDLHDPKSAALGLKGGAAWAADSIDKLNTGLGRNAQRRASKEVEGGEKV